MLKKITFISLMLACVLSSFSQSSINDYKYVIVPDKYDFLNKADEYQLNSLSKYLFNKHGFVAIMANEPMPEDLIKNGCLALTADVLKDGGVFKTKLQIELKNCRKEVVYLSHYGESREKSFKVAYTMAIRQAFDFLSSLNYKYKPVENLNSSSEPVITSTSIVAASESTIKSETIKSEAIIDSKNTSEILYAQPTSNGYQLVDSTPKVLYTLIFSGKKDFYMVKGKDASVYKLDDKWVIAESINEELIVTILNIKF